MARDSRKAFLRELEKVSPQLARAFQAAIQDVRSTAQARLIEEAIRRGLETGNTYRAAQEVMASLQLGAEFFAPLDRAIQEAFNAGATYQLSLLPKQRSNTAPLLQVRFQGRHPRAEAWTRDRAGALITELTGPDMEQAIRETIDAGIRENRGYRTIALDLIGRPEGNQRKGGVVGLHSRQAEAVNKARAELSDPETMSDYLRRERRDRRFDKLVKRARAEGMELSQADITKITGRYSDRLLQLRGQTIARTEGNKAMNAGRTEAIQQMVDDGKLRPDLITKIWDAVIGPHTRDSHLQLNGTEVQWGQQFVSPITGALMDHPHDEDAPARETVNCRCTMRTRIDYAAMSRQSV